MIRESTLCVNALPESIESCALFSQQGHSPFHPFFSRGTLEVGYAKRRSPSSVSHWLMRPLEGYYTLQRRDRRQPCSVHQMTLGHLSKECIVRKAPLVARPTSLRSRRSSPPSLTHTPSITHLVFADLPHQYCTSNCPANQRCRVLIQRISRPHAAVAHPEQRPVDLRCHY